MKNNLKIGMLLSLTGVFAACYPSANSSDERQDKPGKQEDLAKVDNGMERNADADKRWYIHVADANFISTAAEGGQMEVAMGKLALTKAVSEEIKQFAKMMVEDHSKANTELKALADGKNIRLSEGLSNQSKGQISALQQNEGKDFEREYMRAMVKDHKIMAEVFQSEAINGYDSLMKAHAFNKVPTLLHHLKMAEKISNEMGYKPAN
jgi:putative membrane protein